MNEEQKRNDTERVKRRDILPSEGKSRKFLTREVAHWFPLVPLGILAALFKFVFAGYSFSALVCVGLMGLCVFYNLARLFRGRFPKTIKVVTYVVSGILCAGLLVGLVTEGLIVRASFGEKNPDCEYVVVLGAKVRDDGPSVSLQNRINGAYEYLTDHPDVIAIVSGGQGEDEPMSEAQCMYQRLIEMGIEPERVWMEDQATSTWENLIFSLDLIQQRTGQRPEKIGLLSSEYHLFRAGMFARDLGVQAQGIPAHTTILSQKINHFMREVAGVWHYIILGGNYHD